MILELNLTTLLRKHCVRQSASIVLGIPETDSSGFQLDKAHATIRAARFGLTGQTSRLRKLDENR